MAYFEFPHTRTYDSDLGWIIKHLKYLLDNSETLNAWKALHEAEYEDLKEKVDGLVDNLIDVIVPWDSSIAYRIYSIVEYLGTNYIAIQDVPVGAMITDTTYWVPANTVVQQINAIGLSVSDVIAHSQWYTTPQDYGAAADGVTDDTAAIQAALDSGIPFVFLYGDYYTTDTLVIADHVNADNPIYLYQRGRITYDGNNAAVRFARNQNHVNVNFDSIIASNGDCVEFYCSTYDSLGVKNRNQYINLTFNTFSANSASGACFRFTNDYDPNDLAESDCGWNNEIRIGYGRFSGGAYGAYSDPHGYNRCNNIYFDNVGVEGVTTGFRIGDGCQRWCFRDLRYAESFTDLIVTVGYVTSLSFTGQRMPTASSLNLSNQTDGYINAKYLDSSNTDASAFKSISEGVIYSTMLRWFKSWSYDVNAQRDLRNDLTINGAWLLLLSTSTNADAYSIYHARRQGTAYSFSEITKGSNAQTPVIETDSSSPDFGKVSKLNSTSGTSIQCNFIRLNG